MIFTLWLGKTNPICRLCLKSWLQFYTKIVIYVDFNNIDPFLGGGEYELRNYKDVLDVSIDNLLQFTDFFRFTRLLNEGGTWLDADMYLLKLLPDDKIIISSERTNQTGAYKNKINVYL